LQGGEVITGRALWKPNQGRAHLPQNEGRTAAGAILKDFKKWHELTMPFLDAMYLLNLLAAVKKDSGFQIGE